MFVDIEYLEIGAELRTTTVLICSSFHKKQCVFIQKVSKYVFSFFFWSKCTLLFLKFPRSAHVRE